MAPERREETGLQAVFKSVFPIADYNGNAMLEFHSYHFGDPKYTVEECHDRGMTFAIPLKVTLRLKVVDNDKEAKTQTMREVRGAGGVPRRAAADDGEGYLHHQRHGARGGLPAPALAGRLLRRRQGQDGGLGEAAVLGPGHSLPRARGWSSSSTPTTSSTSGSTGGARCSATAFLRAFWFLEKGCRKPQDILTDEEILGHVLRAGGGALLRGPHGVGEAHPRGAHGTKVGGRRQAAPRTRRRSSRRARRSTRSSSRS